MAQLGHLHCTHTILRHTHTQAHIVHTQRYTHVYVLCGSVLTRLTLLINVVATGTSCLGSGLCPKLAPVGGCRCEALNNAKLSCLMNSWNLEFGFCLPVNAPLPRPNTCSRLLAPSHWRILLHAVLCYVNLLFECPISVCVCVCVCQVVFRLTPWLVKPLGSTIMFDLTK